MKSLQESVAAYIPGSQPNRGCKWVLGGDVGKRSKQEELRCLRRTIPFSSDFQF